MIYMCEWHPSTRVSSYPISRKLFLLIFQSTKISVDRLKDLVYRLSVRHAPMKRTARLRCALQSTIINDFKSSDIYEHFCNISIVYLENYA